jgi:hypothetical protein
VFSIVEFVYGAVSAFLLRYELVDSDVVSRYIIENSKHKVVVIDGHTYIPLTYTTGFQTWE